MTAFFRVTGGLLALMSITLVGSGIRGLQTAALMPATPVPWFPDHAWLQLYLGLYPVSEALLSQANSSGGATTISRMALATSCKASVSAGVTFGLGGSHAACENDDPVTHILTRLLKMPPMALLAYSRIAEDINCSATRRMLTGAVILEVSDPVNAVQKECHEIAGWQVDRLVDGQDCLTMLIVTS